MVRVHTPRYHPRAEIGLPADMCPVSLTIAVGTIASAPTDPYRHQPLYPVSFSGTADILKSPEGLGDGWSRLRQRDTVQIHGIQVWLLPHGAGPAVVAGGPTGHPAGPEGP